MKTIVHRRNYVAARLAEYPPVTDFIDAYYHERKGNPGPMTAYLKRIDEIKARFPKETANAR